MLNQALSRAGFYLLAFDSYPAEIRGFGRCVTHARVGDEQMLALKPRTDVLISLDDTQSRARVPFLAENAVVLFDNKPPSYVSEDHAIAAHVRPDVQLFGIPFAELSTRASGTTRGQNLAALGGFAALFDFRPHPFMRSSEKSFRPKGMRLSRPISKALTLAISMSWKIFNKT